MRSRWPMERTESPVVVVYEECRTADNHARRGYLRSLAVNYQRHCISHSKTRRREVANQVEVPFEARLHVLRVVAFADQPFKQTILTWANVEPGAGGERQTPSRLRKNSESIKPRERRWDWPQ